MLRDMWVFPLLAALIALSFAGLLMRQWFARRRTYQAIWAIALLMYAVACFEVFLGGLGGWTSGEFRVYWLLGAVLNVPFLALGELELLVRHKGVRTAMYAITVFVTAYAIARVRTAGIHAAALAEDLPSGKEVFGDGTAAHRLPQLISIPAYAVLVGGAVWSAMRMRGRIELRDRFVGTLLIALGATVIAGFGSAFAALGYLAAFTISLLAGIAIMFWGFLRASRRTQVPSSATADGSSA
jgi:hypothetical protein